MKRATHVQIFRFLIGCIFLTPLLFYFGFLSPFTGTQTVYFVWMIELVLPYYLFLLYRFPEYKPSVRSIFLLTWVGLLLVLTVSAFFGVDPWNSFWGNINRTDGLLVHYHLFLFFLYLQFFLRTQEQNTLFLIRSVVGISGMTAVIGLLQFTHILPSVSQEFGGTRVASTLGNPIFFAASLIIPFFLSVYLFQKAKSRTHQFYRASTTTVLFLGILVSGTRGAFLGIFSGILLSGILWILTHPSKKIRQRGLIGLLSFLFICLAFFWGARTYAPKKTTLYHITHFTDQSVTSRLDYWKFALDGWKKHPWLGVGHQNFYSIADQYYQKRLYDSGRIWPDKVHNAPLEILITGGIFAFVLYLFLYAWTIWVILKTPSFSPWQKALLTSALFAYFIQNCFSFDTIVPSIQLIFFFSILHPLPPNLSHRHVSKIWSPVAFMSVAYVLGTFLLPINKELTLLRSTQGNNFASVFTDLTRAQNLPFLFDTSPIAKQFVDLQKIISTNASVSQQDKTKIMDAAITFTETETQRHPHRAYSWYLHATSLDLHARTLGIQHTERSFEAAKRLLELAPYRTEPFIVFSNMFDTNNNAEEAKSYGYKAIEIEPDNPEALWNLTYLYLKEQNLERAADFAVQSLHKGKKLQKSETLKWVIDYYAQTKNYPQLIFVYERSVRIEPDNLVLLYQLAEAYAAGGQKEKALETALLLKQKAPTSAASVDAFIQSLQTIR